MVDVYTTYTECTIHVASAIYTVYNKYRRSTMSGCYPVTSGTAEPLAGSCLVPSRTAEPLAGCLLLTNRTAEPLAGCLPLTNSTAEPLAGCLPLTTFTLPGRGQRIESRGRSSFSEHVKPTDHATHCFSSDARCVSSSCCTPIPKTDVFPASVRAGTL